MKTASRGRISAQVGRLQTALSSKRSARYGQWSPRPQAFSASHLSSQHSRQHDSALIARPPAQEVKALLSSLVALGQAYLCFKSPS